MQKRFEPQEYEQKWQQAWSEADLFRCPESSDQEAFCIMIPPPNVTGKLHMGHALQSALQDLIVRRKRMQGLNALWLPGTDHAGIATQLMVERQLESEGTSRLEIGREAFLKRAWEWKEQYHSNIRRQLELLGSSCDFSRERFTLDEGLSKAVRTAFVELHRQGLVYRAKYMVNWSPVLGTAVSDLEVESKEVDGNLWHFRYPVAEGDGAIVVATTRPETMLGDMAVAVHPDDQRYAALVGAEVELPIVGRRIPVIADEYVDPEFGTGAVKITPFHDPNDFDMAKRHDLEGVRVIDFDGRMTSDAGEDFLGLDRFEARKQVVARLDELGLLVKVAPHRHAVGHSQRSGEPVEPMVSTQWFVNVEEMAKRSLDAVENGDLELIPATWGKTWEHWLTNVRPWVVSRQLWWGHQIPAWYTPDGECVVAMDREEAEQLAGTSELEQDPDVLDTWFSSGLWPFSTLGWPDETADLDTFYPTNVLVTGFDILFFWVARMTMMGLQFTDQVPFRQVHLTGLVRDADGEKMSKTKGNVLDPLDMVDEYGADAVRFTLCALDVPGRDIPLNPSVMAGYRAFGNKIWNATRFVLTRVAEESGDGAIVVPETLDLEGLEEPERWLLSRFTHTAEVVNARIDDFRFDEACQRLYDFFWKELCDWAIEFAKPALSGEAPRPHVGEVLLWVIDHSLRLLHPVMPHLTEELWQKLPREDAPDKPFLATAAYPEADPGLRDVGLEERIEGLQQAISRVRAFRKERNLPRTVAVQLYVEGGENQAFVVERAAQIRFLTGVEAVHAQAAPDGAVRDRIAGLDLAIVADIPPLTDQERARLEKELEKIDAESRGAEGRLANPGFLASAPEHVVEGTRRRLEELRERRRVVESELA